MNRILFAVTLASSLLLSAFWSEPSTKAGCGWDPWGQCNPAPQPQPATDAGCGADPWGCPKGS